jgi:hypothetical protein
MVVWGRRTNTFFICVNLRESAAKKRIRNRRWTQTNADGCVGEKDKHFIFICVNLRASAVKRSRTADGRRRTRMVVWAGKGQTLFFICVNLRASAVKKEVETADGRR